jgi:hypothetical protein
MDPFPFGSDDDTDPYDTPDEKDNDVKTLHTLASLCDRPNSEVEVGEEGRGLENPAEPECELLSVVEEILGKPAVRDRSLIWPLILLLGRYILIEYGLPLQ